MYKANETLDDVDKEGSRGQSLRYAARHEVHHYWYQMYNCRTAKIYTMQLAALYLDSCL